jgi:hypothetical protein
MSEAQPYSLLLPIIIGKTEITVIEFGAPRTRSRQSVDNPEKRSNKFRVVYSDLDINERRLVDEFFKLVEGRDRPWDFEHGRRRYDPCHFDSEAIFWSRSQHGFSATMQFRGMKD